MRVPSRKIVFVYDQSSFFATHCKRASLLLLLLLLRLLVLSVSDASPAVTGFSLAKAFRRIALLSRLAAQCLSYRLLKCFDRIVATLRIDSVKHLLSQGNTQPNSSVCSVQGIPAVLPQPLFLPFVQQIALHDNCMRGERKQIWIEA